MSDGEIVWAVKRSLTRYIRGAGGMIESTGGAWEDEDGRFHFPLTSDTDEPTGRKAGRGIVRMSAHGGLLSLVIADPHLERHGDRTQLSVRLDEHASARTVMAEVRPSADEPWGGALPWRASETRLTEAGADALGALHYFAGQRIDGVELVVTHYSLAHHA